MGNLLDQLQNNSERAKKENEELEIERDKLIKVRNDAEQQIRDLKKDQTEH